MKSFTASQLIFSNGFTSMLCCSCKGGLTTDLKDEEVYISCHRLEQMFGQYLDVVYISWDLSALASNSLIGDVINEVRNFQHFQMCIILFTV